MNKEQQEQLEKIREKIADDLCMQDGKPCSECTKRAAEFLSLSIGRYKLSELIKLTSRGNELAELDEKQELPANIYNDNQYGISQQDMLKANWKKTIPQEG